MVTAIIVAAGKGVRMQSRQRKQYLPLADVPILAHTLKVFCECERVNRIHLVIPRNDVEYCRKHILDRFQPQPNITLISGGERRQNSVYNGLQQITSDCRVVVIHDGVRPFVQPDQITACIDGALKFGACILAVPAQDTLKQTDRSGHIVGTLARDTIWLAQTPQAFRRDLIQKAHEQAMLEGFEGTDDASLVERLNQTVAIHPGSRQNMKITNKEDLIIARTLLNDPSRAL
jgi:2-C-methyl-D-erythritol 4-phosphate cytidylyltransferase